MKLRKEHFKVMMKVWLNAGGKTNSKLLNDSEMTFFNDLVKKGYIKIANNSYSFVSYKTEFYKVMENFLENLEIMNALLSNDDNDKKGLRESATYPRMGRKNGQRRKEITSREY